MMTRKIFLYIFLIILISTINLYPQMDTDFPSIAQQDIPGGIISKSSYFDGDGLWGHINGGADLYLEYGFDKLLFQDIDWKDHNFRVEYYRMKSPESAFGIYSTSIFKCSKRDTISRYVCISPYQVQSALGRFYISIANNKGTKEATKLTIELFSTINRKSAEQPYELPKLVGDNFLEDNLLNIKLVKGNLGIQNGFPELSGLFEEFSGYSLYHDPISSTSIVNFKSEKDLARFIEKGKVLSAERFKMNPITGNYLLLRN